MDISGSMLRIPSKLLRKLAQEKDIGLATTHKAVREKLKLFPYNVTAVKELKSADNAKRIQHFYTCTAIFRTRCTIIQALYTVSIMWASDSFVN
jgi:hypothetical protein